ncbi:heme-binding protein [Amycolatopsis sp. NPDC051371]|uniref:heme-binding protein n=1 Tax=Amycolatopsis sp. NPDC051371 TaxID=3155800 RepID=UPI003416C0F1
MDRGLVPARDAHLELPGHRSACGAVGGGFPLFDDGVCVGGLGISGGTVHQDEDAAHAALTA